MVSSAGAARHSPRRADGRRRRPWRLAGGECRLGLCARHRATTLETPRAAVPRRRYRALCRQRLGRLFPATPAAGLPPQRRDSMHALGMPARARKRASPCSPAEAIRDAGQEPIVESTPPNPISPYGVHKLVAEQLCRSYARHFSLRLAIVRLFSVYGELRKQPPWDACVASSAATASSVAARVRDWLHVRAAASIYAATLAATPERDDQRCSRCRRDGSDIVSKIFSYLGRRRADLYQSVARATPTATLPTSVGRESSAGFPASPCATACANRRPVHPAARMIEPR